MTDLVPRQQLLLKRPDVTKVLTLTVDPKSYWIYTNTPVDNERVRMVTHLDVDRNDVEKASAVVQEVLHR